MLVLHADDEDFYIHCSLLGTSVNEIPGIRVHALGYEKDLLEWDPRPVGHYVRSVYAIAHGIALPEWCDAGDDWQGQLWDVAHAPDFAELLTVLRSPWKQRILMDVVAPCISMIRDDLSLQWTESLGDEENVGKMDAVEDAWIRWSEAIAPDEQTEHAIRFLTKGALVRKVAETCPWTVFENLRGRMDDDFEAQVLREFKELVCEAHEEAGLDE